MQMMFNDDVELLAPAGNYEAFLAAVENGADSVYLGGKVLNARQSAANFDNEELKRAIDYAHVRGVKVFLTMNTLINDRELKSAVDFVLKAYCMDIDAVIVQDIGFSRVLKELMPDIVLHASTQMTVYNLDGVNVLKQLGFKRAVLARELSLDEIKYISKNSDIEVEVFVHGALCISYSGQCLMSSMIGGRSGNRGRCAQPCRLKYKLICEEGRDSLRNKENVLGEGYLLSPKDISYIRELDSIVNSGVKCLKIEGRMKTPEYVATVVRIYRKYLDLIKNRETQNANLGKDNTNIINGEWSQIRFFDVKDKKEKIIIENRDMTDLNQIFNRGGFSLGYLLGKIGSNMMCYEKPKNWGVYLGETICYEKYAKMLTVRLENAISIGDGIEVWNGQDESPGTIVTCIIKDGRNVKRAEKGEIVTLGDLSSDGKIIKGNKVYKTSDKNLNLTSANTYSQGKFLRKVLINGVLTIKSFMPIRFEICDNLGNIVIVESECIPEESINKPLLRSRILEQMNKTGSTPFEFTNIVVDFDENLTVPIKELNDLRRRALEDLERRRIEFYTLGRDKYFKDFNNDLHIQFENNRTCRKAHEKKISVFLYEWSGDMDYLRLGADRVYLPFSSFLDSKNVDAFKMLMKDADPEICEVYVWFPPITRGNYDKLIQQKFEEIAGLPLAGVMIGNLGALKYLEEYFNRDETKKKDFKIVGDYSLNIFNSSTGLEMFRLGISGATLSPELTLPVIRDMAVIDNFETEYIVYGRITLMTSEYCPVGSVTGGTGIREKCLACLKNGKYVLEDRRHVKFPILCDTLDCRIVILNSDVKLFNGGNLDKIKSLCVDVLRLNILDEKPGEIRNIIGKLKGLGIRD